MAMSGMRDLSIIATPPARRLAVKTFVREYDAPWCARRSCAKRCAAAVYYLFNDVENIQKAADKLAELVPEARIAIGHGQMRERELERVMNDFHHQRFNVLVCTTIIETGIDIPTANTIIIERADHFGLAQLHQLRGRVGRSHHQAYAWLLTPHPKAMTTDAQKRLEAIASLEDLGAGFALATHDLEIRGAGELLGEDQSGQMETIGFSLYMELLENAVDALKAGREPRWKISPVSRRRLNCACLPCCLMISSLTSIRACHSISALPAPKRTGSGGDQSRADRSFWPPARCRPQPAGYRPSASAGARDPQAGKQRKGGVIEFNEKTTSIRCG